MEHYGDEDLSRYLDEETGPEEAAKARQHLAECADCRQRFDELSLLRAAAREMVELEPPDAVWLRIRQRTGNGREPVRRRAFGRLAWLGIPALAAACLVVFVVTGRRPEPARLVVERPEPAAVETAPVPVAAAAPVPVMRRAEPRVAARPAAAAPEPAVAEAPAESIVVTSTGVAVALKPGEVLREYLGGMRRAADDARAAMVENPRHPRVRQVFTSATMNRVEVLDRLSTGGE